MELSKYFNNLLKEKNITIEIIHEKTKIPKTFLFSIKKSDYSNFPPHVYSKGYLKELEKFFNLTNNELTSFYENLAIDENRNNDFKYEPLLNINKNKSNYRILLYIFIFIIIFFIVLFFILNKKQEKESVIIEKQEKQVVKHKNITSEDKIISQRTDIKKEKIAVIDNKTKNLISNISKKIDNITQELKDEIPEKVVIPDSDSYIITLTPLERVWVRINADNKTHKNIFLSSKPLTINAKSFIKVDIGNAGNLKIFINNRKYPLNGKKGEVKHIFIKLKDFDYKKDNYTN
jgi:preprotein translocase subunit YajC